MGFACMYAVCIEVYRNLIPGLFLFKWLWNKSKGESIEELASVPSHRELWAIGAAVTVLQLSIPAARLPGFTLFIYLINIFIL